MNIRYCYMAAAIECGETRHAEVVMKELGITYSHATPQSIVDQWWFWNCNNVPAKMPKFLKELNLNPLDQIGIGLSHNEAEEIERIKNEL